jgi:FkbM family methyltransferase
LIPASFIPRKVRENMFKNSNLRIYEYIVAYANNLIILITSLLSYYGTYRNYFNVLMHVLKRKYPIEAVLRKDDRHIILHSHVEAYFFTLIHNREGIHYDMGNDMVTFEGIHYDMGNDMVTLSSSSIPHPDYANRNLRLYGGITNGDILDTFLRNEYQFPPVKGKTVVDIGANIGDTPIYFAVRGASKVIALEPHPKNYELAKRNIEANNFSDRIVILLAGCAAKCGFITIDPNKSGIFSPLMKSGYGIKVPLLTLENILNENNISEAVLKIDCEGCEYETILSAPDYVLKHFSGIHIEYHYGYKDLKEKLEKSGFNVSVTKPAVMGSVQHESSRKQYIGHIYAKRNLQVAT